MPYRYTAEDDASWRQTDDDRSLSVSAAADDSVDATPIFSEPRNDSLYSDDSSNFDGEGSCIPEQITAAFDDADSCDKFPEFGDYCAHCPTNESRSANDSRELTFRSLMNLAVLCSMLLALISAWSVMSSIV